MKKFILYMLPILNIYSIFGDINITVNEDKTVIRLNCKSHYDPDRGAGHTGGIIYFIKVK